MAAERATRSALRNFDDRCRKGLRGFLRQVVTDAAIQQPVRVLAGELLSIQTGIRVWRTVGVAFKRDGGHGDRRTRRKLLFRIVSDTRDIRETGPSMVATRKFRRKNASELSIGSSLLVKITGDVAIQAGFSAEATSQAAPNRTASI